MKVVNEKGMDYYLKHEKERLKCPECSGVLNIHHKKCSECGKVFE
jgi:ribosomal protein S27AE